MSQCGCGCGQDSGVYVKTANGYGRAAGAPRRFLPGHHAEQPRSPGKGRIGTHELRRAVERAVKGGLSYSEIARRCGWVREFPSYTAGDTTRLKRCIGLAGHRTSSGTYTHMARTVRNDVALKIIRAIDADPVQFGL